MKKTAPVQSEFLNVDLNFRCSRNPDPVVRAFGDRVLTQYVDTTPRRHWLLFELAYPMPRDPHDAIRRFEKLVHQLRGDARSIWRSARKEFDIGVQAGFEPSSAEWVLQPQIVEAAARAGAQIRFTVYSPVFVLRAEDPDSPIIKALDATRTTRRKQR